MLLPPKRIKLQPIKEETNDLTLPKQVAKSNREDKLCKEIYEYLTNSKGLEKPDIFCKGLRVDDRLLLKENKLWVSNDSELWLKVIREVHDQPIVGHPGVERTLEMIRQSYCWLKMKKTTQQYIRNCHACKRAKAPRDIYHRLL